MANTLDGLIRPEAARQPASRILVVAGEESGDVYAGQITRSLKSLIDGLEVEGIGGRRMREAGGHTFHDVSEMSSVGVASMLGRLKFFLGVLGEIKQKIAAGEYDAVVLIDYPDFNLRVAMAAEASATPVFYYVCPQLWAWRRYRVKTLRRYVDAVFVAFPFEEDFYNKRGVNAHFLGHPLLDELKPVENAEELRHEFGASPNHTLLGLVPGSRRGEVTRMLPMMLESLKMIRAKKAVKVVIPCADSVDLKLVERIVEQSGEEAMVVKGRTWEAMNACDFLICKSGTSSLQAAMAGTPMIIVYKSDGLSYVLAKSLSHVKWAGLPNLLAGREITPELIQWKMTSRDIAEKTLEYLTDTEKRDEMKRELDAVRASLGQPGAPDRAARMMVDYLKKLKNV